MDDELTSWTSACKIDNRRQSARTGLQPNLAALAAMNYLKPYAVAIASLLAGASLVHNIYKPDLVGLRATTSTGILLSLMSLIT